MSAASAIRGTAPLVAPVKGLYLWPAAQREAGTAGHTHSLRTWAAEEPLLPRVGDARDPPPAFTFTYFSKALL